MKPNYKIVFKDGKKTFVVDGTVIDKFELLAIAYESDNKKDARETMRAVSILYHADNDPVFDSLYDAVEECIIAKFIKNEFYYQDLFKKHYSKIYKGEVINKKSNGKDIPDVWVKESGKEIPVEVKLNKFDNKALKQLKRYMDVYECDKGYAVGRVLTVDLPSNIKFVPLEILEILEKTNKE